MMSATTPVAEPTDNVRVDARPQSSPQSVSLPLREQIAVLDGDGDGGGDSDRDGEANGNDGG
jgi:hypothetical protein